METVEDLVISSSKALLILLRNPWLAMWRKRHKRRIMKGKILIGKTEQEGKRKGGKERRRAMETGEKRGSGRVTGREAWRKICLSVYEGLVEDAALSFPGKQDNDCQQVVCIYDIMKIFMFFDLISRNLSLRGNFNKIPHLFVYIHKILLQQFS